MNLDKRIEAKNSSNLKKGSILGFGNPIVDMVATVDVQFLIKWNLQSDVLNTVEGEAEALERDLRSQYEIENFLGGSVQNTLRTIQWLLSFEPNVCTFMGCLGKDDLGKQLITQLTQEGINCVCHSDESEETGRCLVLVTEANNNRTLVPIGGAHRKLTNEHLLNNWSYIEKAKIIYFTGFQLRTCSSFAVKIAEKVSKESEKLLCFNFGSTKASEKWIEYTEKIISCADVIFGNEGEIMAYSRAKNWRVDCINLALQILLKQRPTSSKTFLVVVTRGSEAVLVGSKDFEGLREFPVPRIESTRIKDTIGAGDAFVAGFISQLVQERSLDRCISIAIYAAQEIIQQRGCSYPKHPPVTYPPEDI